MKFFDRRDAGRRLASKLETKDFQDPIVLALPRGGVPVAFEVAQTLHAPMDVFVARKVGAPGQAEFGIGAIAEGGFQVFDERAVSILGTTAAQLRSLARAEQLELERRVEEYRAGRPLPSLVGRDVILVDDGLATGVTAEAALRSLKSQHPRRLVLAAPVCAQPTRDRLAAIADQVICAEAPHSFLAVGLWYENFSQTSDEEVRQILAAASHDATSA